MLEVTPIFNQKPEKDIKNIVDSISNLDLESESSPINKAPQESNFIQLHVEKKSTLSREIKHQGTIVDNSTLPFLTRKTRILFSYFQVGNLQKYVFKKVGFLFQEIR